MISGGKFTGRTFLRAVAAYLRHHDQKKQAKQAKAPEKAGKEGRQSLKSLLGQGQALDSIELDSLETRQFEKAARKYNVDYAIKRERGSGKYYIFFKGRDTGSINTAFREYTAAMQNMQQKQNKARRAARSHTRGRYRPPLALRLARAKQVLAQMGQGLNRGPRVRQHQPPTR